MNSRVRPALFAVTAMRASTLYDTHTRHQRLQRARQRRREHVRALSAGLLVLGGAAVYLDSASAYTPREASGPGAEPQTMEQLLTAVTEDVDAYWTQAFRDAGLPEPKVGYAWIPAGQTATSACGDEQGTVGDDAAAYCPGDDTIYISQKFATDIYDGALDEALPGSSQGYGHTIGDFSVAYLVAHEYGHQVQDELGLFERYGEQVPTMAFELQADCYAGTWANHANAEHRLEAGDVEEALDAALAVGDFDTANPAHHGTPEQRAEAWNHGFASGAPSACSRYLEAA